MIIRNRIMNRLKNIFLAVLGCALLFALDSCVKESFEEEDSYIPKNPSEGGESSTNPYWDWADKFPGVVPSGIERVHNEDVTVNGGYDPLAIAPETPVLQSSGYYVASGDYVTIEVPANVTNLHWQIGIGYPLLDGQLRNRYTDVTSRGELQPGENRISSYFGGYLYFYYEPEDVPSEDITVKVSGVVPSDDYHLGETVQSEWLTVMQERANLLQHPVENVDSMAFLSWTELHSKHMILTAGVPEISNLQYPDRLLEAYDVLIETCYKWAGLDIESQPKLRLYTDIQLPDAGQTVGSKSAKLNYYGIYPMGFRRGEGVSIAAAAPKLMNLQMVLGHISDGAEFMTLTYSLAEAFSGAWMHNEYFNTYIGKIFLMYYTYLTQGISSNNITTNFANRVAGLMQYEDVNHSNGNAFTAFMKANEHDDRLTFFMQLAQQYGWPLYTFVNQRAKELGITYDGSSELNEMEYFDFFAMCAAEYSGKNLLPFLDKWKFPISTAAKQYLALFPEEEEFWTSYDLAVTPSFTPLEPDLSHVSQRPPFGLSLNWTPSDEKEYWWLRGEKQVWETGELKGQNDSDSNKNWKNVYDNDVRTNFNFFTPVRDMQQAKDGKPQYRTIFEMDFMRPIEDEPDPQLHTFNALAFSNAISDRGIRAIYNMQYMDENGEWHDTKPAHFRLYLYTDNNNKVFPDFYYYPFEETYKAKKFKYELLSIYEGNRISEIIFRDIDWVTIDPVENENTGAED